MIRILLDIRCGRDEFDDIDSLRNRRIRCVDELLESHCRQSIVKIAIAARDRISSVVPNSTVAITPSYALLTKPVCNIHKRVFWFFATITINRSSKCFVGS